MRIRFENDWHWFEESGVDGQGRVCFGSMDHPSPWLPRLRVRPFRVRFRDKVHHAAFTAALAMWLGPLWAFALMTLGVEVLAAWLYDPKADIRIGIWDVAANAVGAAAVLLLRM